MQLWSVIFLLSTWPKRANIFLRGIISPTYLKEQLSQLLHQIWRNEWTTSLAGGTTRLFFQSPDSALILEEIDIPYTAMQILTGHSRLNSFLSRFQATTSALCNCLLEEETVSHFLFRCPNFESQQEIFRNSLSTVNVQWPPQLRELTQSHKHLKMLINYISSTNRLNLSV